MKKKSLYPYLILIASCGLVGITFGVSNTQGLFFESMCEDLGVGKGALSFYVTLCILIAAPLSSSICPRIRKKYPIRLVLATVGGIVFAFMLLVPTFKNLYLFYLYGLVLGAGIGFYGHTLAVEILNNWFEKSGTVCGVAMAASGIFGMLFSPLAVSLIDAYGWRKAYYSYAVIFFIIMAYILIVIRKSPNEKQVEDKPAEKEKSIINKDTLMLSLFYLGGDSMTAIGTYILPYALTLGLSSSQGAIMSTCLNAGNLVLKLLIGYLSDKIGGLKAAIINFIFVTIGVISLLLCKSDMYTILLVGTFLLGSCYGASNVTLQGVCKELYGRDGVAKHYASLSIFGLISSFSTTLIGYSYDVLKTYRYAIIFIEALLAIGTLLIIILYRKKKIESK